MKKLFIPLFMFTLFLNAQTPCENGFAGEYPCDKIDLLSFMPNSLFEANRGNDCWGWTDTLTSKEYALFGNSANTAFVDVTDPINPKYIGKLNSHTGTSIWRDIKVYNDYAFIVSEAGGHGMQVFDLTRLRESFDEPQVFTENAFDGSFGGAHNIVINEETGYAYIVGANVYGGGPEFINIQDPINPKVEGGFGDAGYSHDAQVVIYQGVDSAYQNKEIYFGANEHSIAIIDVTDKASPNIISQFSYPLVSYTHQLWTDENQHYLFVNDELDEQKYGNNTRTLVFDISDLENPVFKTEYLGKTTAIDHNNYVVDDELYIANYRAGIRIIDISDLDNSDSLNTTMKEVAFFDTYPNDDFPRFDGAWSVYPYFKSGTIIISDINKGLFIVKKSGFPDSNIEVKKNSILSIYPNPSYGKLILESSDKEIDLISIYDILGNKIKEVKGNNTLRQTVNVNNLKNGIYIINVDGGYQKIEKIN